MDFRNLLTNRTARIIFLALVTIAPGLAWISGYVALDPWVVFGLMLVWPTVAVVMSFRSGKTLAALKKANEAASQRANDQNAANVQLKKTREKNRELLVKLESALADLDAKDAAMKELERRLAAAEAAKADGAEKPPAEKPAVAAPPKHRADSAPVRHEAPPPASSAPPASPPAEVGAPAVAQQRPLAPPKLEEALLEPHVSRENFDGVKGQVLCVSFGKDSKGKVKGSRFEDAAEANCPGRLPFSDDGDRDPEIQKIVQLHQGQGRTLIFRQSEEGAYVVEDGQAGYPDFAARSMDRPASAIIMWRCPPEEPSIPPAS